MDGFGVTVSANLAERLETARRDAEIARAIMATIAKSDLPMPPEDITLEYLAGDGGDGEHVPAYADTSRGPRP